MRQDPIELEIFKNIYHSIAEEMGAALRRTAFSPNIKERRDYSCAVFDARGEVIAMGDHMPVHLGSMPMSVRAAIESFPLQPRRHGHAERSLSRRDAFAGHHTGGAGVCAAQTARAKMPSRQPARTPALQEPGNRGPDFYVASRAHHADVGGTYPGSMGLCREIYQEGLRIPPVRIMRVGDDGARRSGVAVEATSARRMSAKAIWGRRSRPATPGPSVCAKSVERYGLERAQSASRALLEYSERMMRGFLARVPPGTYRAEDFMDSDGISDRPVKIAVAVKFEGKERSRVSDPARTGRRPVPTQPVVTVDFTGSDPQVEGSINAVEAITYSACFYVFRCLLEEDVPATAGLMRPIRVIAPSGTVVNARPPAAVAGGNVETSQRIVDVLLRALAQAVPERIPAAASGTMNNLTIGGIDPRTGEPFAYYETIAGGMGARPTKPGVSGVHTHMTNSLNTPAEALEYSYPLRVRQYSLRRGSGGAGKHRGGDGIVREIEVLTDAEVTLLSDRRTRGPWGLSGGADGSPGNASVIRRDGSTEQLPGKIQCATTHRGAHQD